MQFRVLGYSKDNGAKVTLEFEAQSKADAERKAIRQNVEVTRVELASEADARTANTPPGKPAAPGAYSPVARSSGIFGTLVLLLIVAAVFAAAWYFRADIMRLIKR